MLRCTVKLIGNLKNGLALQIMFVVAINFNITLILPACFARPNPIYPGYLPSPARLSHPSGGRTSGSLVNIKRQPKERAAEESAGGAFPLCRALKFLIKFIPNETCRGAERARFSQSPFYGPETKEARVGCELILSLSDERDNDQQVKLKNRGSNN